MNLQESEVFALQFHNDVLKMAKFLGTKVKPLWEQHNFSSVRDISLDGLLLRLIAWMFSLRKLDHGVDIQPIVTGVRSLLETTTDLILIYYDKTDESAWRMRQWGESAKLKSAKVTIAYFKNRAKKAVPDEYQPFIYFIDNEESSIVHIRKQLGWVDAKDATKDKHPERWTNRATLLDDIRVADTLHNTVTEKHFGSNLEYFYETEYRRLNWNIHGSGLTGIRNVDKEGINLVRGFGYRWCAKLAVICTDIVLREMKDKGINEEIDSLIPELEYISVNID